MSKKSAHVNKKEGREAPPSKDTQQEGASMGTESEDDEQDWFSAPAMVRVQWALEGIEDDERNREHKVRRIFMSLPTCSGSASGMRRISLLQL